MRATLEADHSDAESGAESETGVASFKRSNPGQLAKLQLHQALTHRGKARRSGSASGSMSGSSNPDSPMMGVLSSARQSKGSDRGSPTKGAESE